MVDKRIGVRIKECRERAGMTQEQLAEASDISTGYLSSIERGERFPRIENLISILNAMKASANDIFIDVLDNADLIEASELTKRINALPITEQRRILAVLETLLADAEGRK